MKKFIFLSCFLIACSCGKSPLAKYGRPFETIMNNDTSFFRGINFQMSSGDIRRLETRGLKENDSTDGINYLFYELKADSSTSYTLAYSCPNNKLNNIEADIYLINEPQAADLFNSFKSYFETKFGPAQSSGDFLLWSSASSPGRMRVELADESPTYKRGKLTLVIRILQENEEQ